MNCVKHSTNPTFLTVVFIPLSGKKQIHWHLENDLIILFLTAKRYILISASGFFVVHDKFNKAGASHYFKSIAGTHFSRVGLYLGYQKET